MRRIKELTWCYSKGLKFKSIFFPFDPLYMSRSKTKHQVCFSLNLLIEHLSQAKTSWNTKRMLFQNMESQFFNRNAWVGDAFEIQILSFKEGTQQRFWLEFEQVWDCLNTVVSSIFFISDNLKSYPISLSLHIFVSHLCTLIFYSSVGDSGVFVFWFDQFWYSLPFDHFCKWITCPYLFLTIIAVRSHYPSQRCT